LLPFFTSGNFIFLGLCFLILLANDPLNSWFSIFKWTYYYYIYFFSSFCYSFLTSAIIYFYFAVIFSAAVSMWTCSTPSSLLSLIYCR
jgi:hypothetical protein